MLTREKVRFVKYLSPGSFVAEEWTRPVDVLDPATVPWPDNAYAFTLWDREDVVDGDERFHGEPARIGPVYYHPDSKVETLAEVERNPSATSTLVRNMTCNRWDRVVWTRWGNWPQPFENGKAVVLPEPAP